MVRRCIIAALVAALPVLAHSQTVTTLKNQPPHGTELTLLLTDGRVLAQGLGNSDWWTLTPDDTGSYVSGTWNQVASLPSNYSPYAMSSAVLADGRVLIEGGEYNFNQFALTNLGAIYDPPNNSWTSFAPPRGWTNIGDSPALVLPRGDFVIGDKLRYSLAALDPATMKWTTLGDTGKHDTNAEEGWTLLPDGSFLTVDVKDNPSSERYFPRQGRWGNSGSTVVNLQGPPCCGCTRYPPHDKCYYPPGEVGPALLMPDGTVFATGAMHSGDTVAHTAIFTSGKNWKAGPDFPNGDQAGDEFAALVPNGHALVETNNGEFYEFDGKSLSDTGIAGKNVSLLLLPDGEVLVDGVEVYSSGGTWQTAWQPAISNCPSTLTRGSSYKISGTQFNGLSQANAFGDELQSATNYPLVRIANNSTKHVFYARTHDHSTMAVATGSAAVSTNFDVPAGMETGASSLVVVANGIPSAPVAVSVQ